MVAGGLWIDSPLTRPHGWRIDSTGNCIERCSTMTPTIADILFYGGLAGYTAGPAIVHLMHEHGGNAWASLGMRLAPPALLLAGTMFCQGTFCPFVVPGLVSIPVVSAIDAASYAYEEVPSSAPTMSFAPLIDVKGRGTGLSVSGTF
jgi:hypothetical protein